MEATFDIFTYASKDIRLSLLLAIRPSDLSNACKMNKKISEYCRSIDFIINYLKRWHDIQGDEKDSLDDIIYEIHPIKLMEICSLSGSALPFCKDEKFLKKYAETWGETNPEEYRRLSFLFTKALKDRDLDQLKKISNFYFYDPHILFNDKDRHRVLEDFRVFDDAVERGDLDIFKIISKGRGTQEFFNANVRRARDREDIGVAVAIFKAAKRGDSKFLKALLEEKRIDPMLIQNSKAIIVAAKNGRLDIVKMLLDVSTLNMKDIALKEAKKGGHNDIIELLEPKRKSIVSPMTEAARKYVEKLGEYHKEFAEQMKEREK